MKLHKNVFISKDYIVALRPYGLFEVALINFIHPVKEFKTLGAAHTWATETLKKYAPK